MNIFVYSDESGVFDQKHNQYFVFGGIIFLSKESRDICSRLYKKAEKDIISNGYYSFNDELKAHIITNREKGKLFRSLNNFYKFGVVIKQEKVYPKLFENKKTKQRYLDYAYKMAIKNAFNSLIRAQAIDSAKVENIYFFNDEHTTATNGKYELRESLEEEFKNGVFKFESNIFHKPLFQNLKTLTLEYCDSKNKTLIRAADIVANRLYFLAKKPNYFELLTKENFFIKTLP